MNNFLTNKKRLLIAGGFAVMGVLLILATTFVVNRGNYNSPESNFIPSDAPATLLNAGDLYALTEPNQYEQLRQDLTNYARNYVNVSDEIVTYELKGNVSVDNENLTFELESKNSPSHKIDVSLEKKPQQRIKLSFVDKNTNSNDFDNQLNSNSQKNVYISTLPENNVSYTIDYSQDDNKFIIFLYDKNPSYRDQAVSEIKTKAKLSEISDSDYNLIVPGVFEDDGLEVEGIEGD